MIWSSVIKEWGLQWCISNSVAGLFHWWMSEKFQKYVRIIWRALPLVILWSLWKHRNDCVFSKAQPNFPGLLDLIKFRSALWLKASVKDFPFSVDDIVFKWK
ncbi:unnamed protein product [Camellia sinensis]